LLKYYVSTTVAALDDVLAAVLIVLERQVLGACLISL
jgi:hypothetical protein